MTRLAVLVSFLASGVGAHAQGYVLRVTHPKASGGILDIEGVSETTTGPLTVGVSLEIPSTGSPVHAWSLGLAHDPNVLALLSATLEGTAGDIPGFSRVDSLADGVVTSAVLDPGHPNVLPAGGSSSLLLATYDGTFPAKDTTIQTRLRLVDGLSGPEGPVSTRVVTWDGQAETTVVPDRQGLIVLLSGFEYSTRFDLSLDTPGARLEGGDAVYRGYVLPGSRPSTTLTVLLDSKLPAGTTEGAQGWSLSIAHDAGTFRVGTVTTQGTDAGPLIRGGFERHETVDNSSGHGLVSAVVLSFSEPVWLPPVGRSRLLRASYVLEADTSVLGSRIQGGVRFQDDLQGQGQPVDNVVTFRGESNRPLVRRGLLFDLTVGVAPQQPFVRSDANDDGRGNIADAIWLLSELYLGGPPTSCALAADVNGDSRRDLSDVAYLIGYQFLGGAPPPSPFPDCGTVPDASSDLCPVGSTRCKE